MKRNIKRGAWLTVKDMLGQRCPRCRLGTMFRYSIFRGWPRMHERCPVCALLFAREPGYFLGAMYVSYLLGLGIIAVIALLLWTFTGWGLIRVTLIGVVFFLPMVPAVTLLSRVLWIYLDQTVDPEGG